MKSESLFVGVLAALVGISCLSAPALAQTDAQKAKAREHFQNGRRLYDVGRYAEAIKEYEQAYLNVEDPVFLFNIAQAYRLDGQYEEAIRAYRAYLRRAPDAQNRTDVEARIAELQREVEAQKRQNNSPPPPPPPVTQPVVQPPPPPVVTGPAPGPVTTPEVQPIAVKKEIGVVDKDTQRWAKRRKTGYILLAGGGGGILLATIFGAIANSKARELEMADVFDKDIEDNGKAASMAAVLLGVGGTIAAGIGVYYLMSGQRPAGSLAQSDAQARAAKAKVGLSFALTPVVAPEYVGAGAALRF